MPEPTWPETIAALKNALAVTDRELAERLTSASPASVAAWRIGRWEPNGANAQALVAMCVVNKIPHPPLPPAPAPASPKTPAKRLPPVAVKPTRPARPRSTDDGVVSEGRLVDGPVETTTPHTPGLQALLLAAEQVGYCRAHLERAEATLRDLMGGASA